MGWLETRTCPRALPTPHYQGAPRSFSVEVATRGAIPDALQFASSTPWHDTSTRCTYDGKNVSSVVAQYRATPGGSGSELVMQASDEFAVLTSKAAVTASALARDVIIDPPPDQGGLSPGVPSRAFTRDEAALFPLSCTVDTADLSDCSNTDGGDDADGMALGVVTWHRVYRAQVGAYESRSFTSSLDSFKPTVLPRFEQDHSTFSLARLGGGPAGVCAGIVALRVVLDSIHPLNETGCVGLSAVQFLTPDAPGQTAPSLIDIVDAAQESLIASIDSTDNDSRELALSMRIAELCGSQSAVVRVVHTLLANIGMLGQPLLPKLREALNSLLTALRNARLPCIIRAAQASLPIDLLSPLRAAPLSFAEAVFDAKASSPRTRLSISVDQRIASSTASMNCMAVCKSGCSTGKWIWKFRFLKDKQGGESTCFGAVAKPISDWSYTASSNVWMYRAYNRGLYGSGAFARSPSRASTRHSSSCYMRRQSDLGLNVLFALFCRRQGTLRGYKAPPWADCIDPLRC